MRNIKYNVVILLLFVGILSSCSDKLSEIGESVQPNIDQVAGTEYELHFESKTISTDKVYSSNTLGLLGNIYDDSFGDFKGEFVAQVRTAPGLKFTPTPIDEKIDSTVIRINFNQFIGSRDLPVRIAVYELGNAVSRKIFSEASLEKYKQESQLIGSEDIVPSNDIYTTKVSGNDIDYFDIKIDNKIGEKIYNLSKNHPEYFKTQESFNKNVFNGVLVTTSTGKGFMVQTVGVTLKIFYSATEKDKDDKKIKVTRSVSFINTNQTAQINSFSNTLNDKLLEDNPKYTYISSPAGVATRLTLRKEELNKLLASQGKINLGHNWIIASAVGLLRVDVPEKSILNPPTNVVVVRSDSVQSFFKNRLPTSGFNAVGFVSTDYSISRHIYAFPNISGIITNFIKEESTFDATKDSWIVKKDLNLDVIPVNRLVTQDPNSGRAYVSLEQYIFPSIVRLSKEPKDLQIRVVTSKFN